MIRFENTDKSRLCIYMMLIISVSNDSYEKTQRLRMIFLRTWRIMMMKFNITLTRSVSVPVLKNIYIYIYIYQFHRILDTSISFLSFKWYFDWILYLISCKIVTWYAFNEFSIDHNLWQVFFFFWKLFNLFDYEYDPILSSF